MRHPPEDPIKHATIDEGMIDSHFHSLEMERKGLDATSILSWSFAKGLAYAVDVSVSLEGFETRSEIAAAFPRLYRTAGLYPSEAAELQRTPGAIEGMMGSLERQLTEERVVAVGEIGLDAVREYAPIELQQELLRRQLALAAAKGLPVVIHNRECDERVLDALRDARVERGGIMHCFSSSYDSAARFIDMGFAISFAGNLTFKSAGDLRETARRLPVGSLLVETDAPYLAPVPCRGRTNHPGYIGHTYALLAELKGMSMGELIEQIKENFAGHFGIGGRANR